MAGTLVVVAVGWALWPGGEEPPPRARQYLEFTACLLTPERGVADPAVAPVWQGMQDASLATRAKVQFLAVAGPQTADNAATFLASLAQGGCDLVFVAGDAPVAAVGASAGRFPAVQFFAVVPPTREPPAPHVGTAGPSSGPADVSRGNLTVIDGGEGAQVKERINSIVTAAVRKSGR